MLVKASDSVMSAKRKLHSDGVVNELPVRQRWYYGGRLLRDRAKLGDVTGLANGHVVQCILAKMNFAVLEAK